MNTDIQNEIENDGNDKDEFINDRRHKVQFFLEKLIQNSKKYQL